GPDTAKGVVLIDTLPEASTFVSASPPPTAQAGGKLTFDLGDLADGATMTFTIVATPTGDGTLTDRADVSAPNGLDDPTPSNNTDSASSTVNPPPTADVGVSVTTSPDPLTLGSGNVTYTVTVVNHGPGAAKGVILTDTLPG